MKKPCQYNRCKNPARGFHCKSCDARVCKEHQEPDGYGNHGGLGGKIKIFQNKAWRRIR